jgi:hypothetical protein
LHERQACVLAAGAEAGEVEGDVFETELRQRFK